MTNGLLIFLALYALVWQPAIVWWMLNNTQLYQLAWLNAWIFLIALIISSIFKPKKSEEKVSRIENDKGVAIVEMEKKTEVVVESGDSENSEENAEAEKLEEKSEEKLMKETVTIPKIVQPLTWHSTSKKRKRESRWGQRLILLITLGIAAVIAWTLWEFLGNRGIAIALFLGWILYLVIGKLFDVNGFYNAKKLFTNRLYVILILTWIGYGVYTMQQEDKSFNLLPAWWSDKAIEYVKGRFKHDDPEPTDTPIIYVFEWTWEVIANTNDTDNLINTWDVENTEIGTWDNEVINAEPEAKDEEDITE